MLITTVRCCVLALLVSQLIAPIAGANRKSITSIDKGTDQSASLRDLQLAARFAPVFYQALGEHARSDYVTNFDFDGDWRGDNNWENADNWTFPLRAYVYYAVVETQTHVFLHYAVFHPRDYKGGERKGVVLSELIREGMKRGAEYDPTGLADEAGVAHENDLEGALVVVTKNEGDLDHAAIEFVETLRHNNFSKYRAGSVNDVGIIRTDDGHAELYVEPKGHGVEAYTGDEKQTGHKEFVIYKFAGKAEDPEKSKDNHVGYDLIPLKTLWTRAKTKSDNVTYGSFENYGDVSINVAHSHGRSVVRKIKIGTIGTAFLGDTGGVNMARPPWAWFDKGRREEKLGLWFFDPATIIKRDFMLDDSFSTVYLRSPFWADK